MILAKSLYELLHPCVAMFYAEASDKEDFSYQQRLGATAIKSFANALGESIISL